MVADQEFLRESIVSSPLGSLLGIEVESMESDHVRLRLPFRQDITTLGDTVHGGALSALIDTAATAAAWTGADLARNPRGTTVALAVNFLAAAPGPDVVADARVIQPGRTVTGLEVVAESAPGS